MNPLKLAILSKEISVYTQQKPYKHIQIIHIPLKHLQKEGYLNLIVRPCLFSPLCSVSLFKSPGAWTNTVARES